MRIMSNIVVPQGVCSCIFCGEQLLWKSDIPFEEMGLEGEGMLVTLECSHCGAMAAFVNKLSDNQKADYRFGSEWEHWLEKVDG